METTAYEGWALVEQMGFRKTVGKVSEVETYGTKMLRLDVPAFAPDGTVTEFVTRFCGGPSLYQVSPLDEALAIDMARRQSAPRPVKPTAYQLTDQSNGSDDSDDDDDSCYDGDVDRLPL